MADHPSLLVATVAALLLLATVWDVRRQRIPNLITFGGALCGFVLQVLLGGLDGLWAGLGGWAVGLAFLLPGFLLGFTGAGDVKLMAASGAYLGPATTLYAAAASVAAGALLALAYLAWVPALRSGAGPWVRYRGMLQCLFVTGRPSYVPPTTDEVAGRRFPYAIAIATGTLGVLAWQMVPI
jgi:prepilin peptidase CpaA